MNPTGQAPRDRSYAPTPPTAKLHCEIESFPIRGRFSISRGFKTEARVVTVILTSGDAKGRGECVPYNRYGESVESVVAAIEEVAPIIEHMPDRAHLQGLMPPGAARNAIDCALWDLEAKRTGVRVFQQAGVASPEPVITAFTISLDEPAAMAMAAAAAAARDYSLLKLKLGGKGDEARLRAVRAAAPAATLIVDANESWKAEDLPAMLATCVEVDVKLIEQPLPAGADAALRDIVHPIPICADESVHDRQGLAALRDRYDAVNVKLDKTGGLTEALQTVAEAEALGFSIMVGSMVGSSLAMAPALLLAERAEYVDLDGSLLLERDRPEGLVCDGSKINPATQLLWG
jgi:L-alanine-DL-glutamate epimerase-like enolase superfamily enzyme